MGISISQDVMIDVLLNVAGYVTAGALCLVVYSMFAGKQKRAKTEPAFAVAQQYAAPGGAAYADRRAEFVDLRTAGAIRDAATGGSRSRNAGLGNPLPGGEKAAGAETASRYERNRAEVIRLAREMLKSGTNGETIRDLLPISEGELALLANE